MAVLAAAVSRRTGRRRNRLVKYWSNTGQILVWSNLKVACDPVLAAAVRRRTGRSPPPGLVGPRPYRLYTGRFPHPLLVGPRPYWPPAPPQVRGVGAGDRTCSSQRARGRLWP